MTGAVLAFRRPDTAPADQSAVEALVELAADLESSRRPNPAAAALSGVAAARDSSRRARRTRTNVHGTVPPPQDEAFVSS